MPAGDAEAEDDEVGARPSGQRPAQDVQAHAAQAQRPGVEVLQARPARQRAIARLLPQPLAHRVGRRLPRQPQVAVQLEAQGP